MENLGSLFVIGLLFGVAAALLSGRKLEGLIAIVGLYAVSLASVGFVGVTVDCAVTPFIVPWVAVPAIGSLIGGVAAILTRPGVLSVLLDPTSPPQAA